MDISKAICACGREFARGNCEVQITGLYTACQPLALSGPRSETNKLVSSRLHGRVQRTATDSSGTMFVRYPWSLIMSAIHGASSCVCVSRRELSMHAAAVLLLVSCSLELVLRQSPEIIVGAKNRCQRESHFLKL